jgi:hypothetical protein
MLSYESNQAVAKFALTPSSNLKKVVEKPLTTFVTAFAKAYLKDSSTSLSDLRGFREEVGIDAFKSIADKLKPPEATKLVARLDPANTKKATEDPAWMRGRLVDLVAGRADPDPLPTPTRAPRGPAPPRRRRSIIEDSSALGAKPKRRQRPGRAAE